MHEGRRGFERVARSDRVDVGTPVDVFDGVSYFAGLGGGVTPEVWFDHALSLRVALSSAANRSRNSSAAGLWPADLRRRHEPQQLWALFQRLVADGMFHFPPRGGDRATEPDPVTQQPACRSLPPSDQSVNPARRAAVHQCAGAVDQLQSVMRAALPTSSKDNCLVRRIQAGLGDQVLVTCLARQRKCIGVAAPCNLVKVGVIGQPAREHSQTPCGRSKRVAGCRVVACCVEVCLACASCSSANWTRAPPPIC